MAFVKCTKCGTKISNVTNGIIKCPSCGHTMKLAAPGGNKQQNAQIQEKTQQKPAKKCKHCKSDMPVDAKICPQCRKKQGGGCLKPVLICFAVFIGLTLLVSMFGGESDEENVESGKEKIAHRSDMYGVSDGDIKDIESPISVQEVRNDVTGKWRVAKIAENIDIEKYVLSYYENYFENDDEIHAIINFNFKTTTKITVMGEFLDVTIYEYVKKEEHDAKMLFSGMVLKEYRVYLDNGDIEELDEKPIDEIVAADISPKSFVKAVKNIEAIKEDKTITKVKLKNKDLCVYIDISKSDTFLPMENYAKIVNISITDNILTLKGYDDLWETITIDFGEIGKIKNNKVDMDTTQEGVRHFVGNPILE